MKKIKNVLGRDFKKQREKDKISESQRSSVMSKIRSRGTLFEKTFIEELLKQKICKNVETNVLDIRGKPDIVLRKKKICIFLDSNFWHGWQYPRWKHLLKNDFWREKIEKNRKRDRQVSFYLRSQGWTVIRIWEHQINKDLSKAFKEILRALG